jgi:Tat protein secretion system quality control protein TatD with DNase activity
MTRAYNILSQEAKISCGVCTHAFDDELTLLVGLFSRIWYFGCSYAYSARDNQILRKAN